MPAIRAFIPFLVLLGIFIIHSCGGGQKSAAPQASGALAPATLRGTGLWAEGDTIVIDPAAIRPQLADQALWTSSAFFVPKTLLGWTSFIDDIDDHGIIRLDVFEAALNCDQGAVDADAGIASALAYLDARAAQLASVGAKARQVVIPIARMPLWLSSSHDTAPLLAFADWRVYHAKPPRDMDAWKTVVSAIAQRLSDLLGSNPELLFEVWNEPDLVWEASTTDYLALYDATAEALTATLSSARIGGPAMNQWKGSVDSSGPLIFALITHAEVNGAPLDFLSWHCFAGVADDFDRSLAGIRTRLAEGPLDPDLIISEWNGVSALRGSSRHAVHFAETLLRFATQGLAGQSVAAWEDFAPTSPGDWSGYGLMTQSGIGKPVHDIHLAFDQIARCSKGCVSGHLGELRIVVGRDDSGALTVLVWDDVLDGDAAALNVIAGSLEPADLIPFFADNAALLAAIRARAAPLPMWQPIFDRAADTLAAAPDKLARMRNIDIRIAGTSAVSVEGAKRVAGTSIDASTDVEASGSTVSFQVTPNVVWILRVVPAVSLRTRS